MDEIVYKNISHEPSTTVALGISSSGVLNPE